MVEGIRQAQALVEELLGLGAGGRDRIVHRAEVVHEHRVGIGMRDGLRIRDRLAEWTDFGLRGPAALLVCRRRQTEEGLVLRPIPVGGAERRADGCHQPRCLFPAHRLVFVECQHADQAGCHQATHYEFVLQHDLHLHKKFFAAKQTTLPARHGSRAMAGSA
jgi:hypothetical protein